MRAHIARLPIITPTGERVHVTASIGVAALDAGSSRELTDLLAAADAALYRAKASGRDQVQMISTSRGLSAVRPGDDPDAGANRVLAGRAAPRGRRPRGRARQRARYRPAVSCPSTWAAAGGGSDSSAATSAIAV